MRAPDWLATVFLMAVSANIHAQTVTIGHWFGPAKATVCPDYHVPIAIHNLGERLLSDYALSVTPPNAVVIRYDRAIGALDVSDCVAGRWLVQVTGEPVREGRTLELIPVGGGISCAGLSLAPVGLGECLGIVRPLLVVPARVKRSADDTPTTVVALLELPLADGATGRQWGVEVGL